MTSKIMALPDALGNPIDFRLLPGQAHELRGTVRSQDRGCHPAQSNRRFPAEFGRHACKWRHLIEGFFGKLKEFRGIATRYCKTDKGLTAVISFAATVIRTR